MCVLAEFIRRESRQPFLDFQRSFSRCEARAVRYAENVCIDGDGRFAECRIQHDARCLATNARQGFERCPVARYFAIVLLKQDSAGLDDVFGLGIVQADRSYVALQLSNTQIENRARRPGNREKHRGRFVDADVRRLRRKDHRNQQFEWRAIVEFGRRAWIPAPQAPEDFASLFLVQDSGRTALVLNSLQAAPVEFVFAGDKKREADERARRQDGQQETTVKQRQPGEYLPAE